jgi:hypothetical protein
MNKAYDKKLSDLAFSFAIDTNELFCNHILTHIRNFKNG